jgi:hypothetical protein
MKTEKTKKKAALLLFCLTCSAPNGQQANAEEPTTRNRITIPQPAQIDPSPEERGLRVDHYPASNERRIELFRPHVENLGGVYIGVGTDQNLTFIAWAKSDFAYLMDFDAVIVAVNKIHLFFIESSETYQDYEKLWSKANRKSSFELLKKRFEGTADFPVIVKGWEEAHKAYSGVPERLKELQYMSRRFGFRSFHNDPEDYGYIRQMILDGRITAVVGDLTGDKTMRSIAQATESLKMPVRLLYLSNAEEYFRYPENYRRNIIELPIDERTLLIRTVTSGTKRFGWPDGEKFEEVPFHYNIQRLDNFKTWMSFRSYLSILTVLDGRSEISRGFSRIDRTPADLKLKESGDIVTKPKGWW